MENVFRQIKEIIELDELENNAFKKALVESALIMFYESERNKPHGESAFDSKLDSKENIDEFTDKFLNYVNTDFLTEAET